MYHVLHLGVCTHILYVLMRVRHAWVMSMRVSTLYRVWKTRCLEQLSFKETPLSNAFLALPPRLLLMVLLKCKESPVVHFGLQCASWVRTSAGSTKRCILAPMGDPNAPSVQKGNLMGSRQGLVAAVLV